MNRDIISIYRLVDEPIDRFDPKICRQHLQECLKKVLRCYDVLSESNDIDDEARAAMNNREYIEALYLLHNLGSSEALARAVRAPQTIRWPLTFKIKWSLSFQLISLNFNIFTFRNSTFNCALKIALSFWTRNLYKCLVHIVKLPYLLCAIASLHVQSIRRFVGQLSEFDQSQFWFHCHFNIYRIT